MTIRPLLSGTTTGAPKGCRQPPSEPQRFHAATKEKDAAAALLRFLTVPVAAAVFKKRGVGPMP